ncbi:MAG TPA: mannose-1-phosphate guanylyltransferase/mannose-6-phosphate isomerase [Steroidobacteraceae bacterium]|jgi:mannose-1-phosphate guanylyltransferase/mannose-6-phosphate isomerase
MLAPVILSGGAGTRLWPLSRELHPKQLLALIGENTMLQDTVRRLAGLEVEAPMVVCNEAHRFLVAEQLRTIECRPRAIVLEPVGRNTAPAIALAAHATLAQVEGDPLLLVLPADHVIGDVAEFHRAIEIAGVAARDGALVTFGVVPTAAEVGYGYIRRGAAAGASYRIAEFVEKPDLTRAQTYVASGEHYWNSGMFLFRARRYLEELERFAPDIAAVCANSFAGAVRDLDFTRINPESFRTCRSESIDYAVMEKTADAIVVPLAAGWSDVGNWTSLHAACDQDAQGNALFGDVMVEDTHDSYVYSASRLVATVGLRNHVVVETKDAVLVAPKDRAQDVKKLVARLKAHGRYEHSLHRQVFRPWGSYDSIDVGERFQVKRLIVHPGGVMSRQMHHHRAEHWVVVSGTAKITRGEETYLLEENESTFIPIGVQHRIENPGRIPLHIIEVQSGGYLGEDDIVRYEDLYGREGTTT